MFQSLRWRLLFAYLSAMLAIFGVSTVAVYIISSRSLNQQLNERLETLTQAAKPSLKVFKEQENKEKNEREKGNGQKHEVLGDEIDWNDVFGQSQGLEWFDADRKLISKEGKTFTKVPIPSSEAASRRMTEGLPIVQQQGQIRSVTIADYPEIPGEENEYRLEGYIRASESTVKLRNQLRQLRWGLEIGGVVALILSGISGTALTWFALQPMRESFQRLKRITAEAAHELRGPLTAISTTVELMQSRPEQLEAADARKLTMIAGATDQIISLVEDLRFLIQTDVDASPSQLSHSPVALNDLLQDLTERFQPQAENKNIQFSPHLLATPLIKGDSHQLSRLFANLIENAIKYTQEGGKVSVFLEKRKRSAIIRIEDTGMGIAKEQLPHVFRQFWRSDNVRAHQEGLGLGLAIVQAIVHRHGGEIEVRSELGVGSSFEVSLPLS